LSRLLKEALENGIFKGICIDEACNITYILFIDDVLIFYEGTKRIVEKFKNILDLLFKVIGMQINLNKSTMSM
jgi:hypothetical protein